MRSPVEINQRSAASIAKWRMQQIIDTDKSLSLLKKFAMEQAIKKGGGVDEIAEMLYGMGIRLSIDQNTPEHAEWISGGYVIVEKP